MGVARLDEVVDPSALDNLIAAAASLGPPLRIEVIDVDGRVVARAGPASVDTGPAVRRRIVADGVAIGDVIVESLSTPADGGTSADAIAAVVAAACSMAASRAPIRPGDGDPSSEVDRRRLDTELAIGRRIQRSLMPRRFPNLPGWEIAAAYEAAREVGGDLYDAFLLRDRPDQLGIVVADVTGKGIPAAILMADARALIHAAADHSDDPAVTLARVNRILVAERATSLFVTVAHGVIDGATGVLTLASAGHDPVHVVRADGALLTLEPPGRLMGMVDDIAATSVRIAIEPGDTIVAHTDGITEARSPDGRFFGEDRFRELLVGVAGRTAAEIVETVVDDVATFRAGAEPSDDLTLLVVRRQPRA